MSARHMEHQRGLRLLTHAFAFLAGLLTAAYAKWALHFFLELHPFRASGAKGDEYGGEYSVTGI